MQSTLRTDDTQILGATDRALVARETCDPISAPLTEITQKLISRATENTTPLHDKDRLMLLI
jgi:hypothetical protein